LARALERVLDDDGLRRRMGEAAFDVAGSEYHAARVVPRLERIYRELIAPTAAPAPDAGLVAREQ
jgi:glycosyltransferase involved in cell wall biosynthesis